MTIGPGGVLALAVGLWACVCTTHGPLGRPSRHWVATPVAFLTVMVCSATVSASSRLVIIYDLALRVQAVDERQELLDLAWGAYLGFCPTTALVVVFVVLLARTRGLWAEGGRLGVVGVAFSGLMASFSLASVAALVVFTVVFLSGGATAMTPAGARVANLMLVGGMALGYLALLIGGTWGMGRVASGAVARFRGWREGFATRRQQQQQQQKKKKRKSATGSAADARARRRRRTGQRNK